MRKRTQIDYAVARRYIGPAVESTGTGSGLQVTCVNKNSRIGMTLQEIRSLFHLGYAFDLRQLKFFEFDTQVIIGSADVPEFVKNIARVKELVNHAQTRALCDRVLEAFPDAECEYVVAVRIQARPSK